MYVMRIRLFASAVLVLISTMFATPALAQDAEQVASLRVGIRATENNFNPFATPKAQPLSHDLLMLVYDSLFWSQSQLDPEPWLATKAESSEDLKTWTVTLRNDVTWHDGEPFTAEDVAFTFEYFRDFGALGRYTRQVRQHPSLASTAVVDDTTVQLVFNQPVPHFRMVPGGDLPILPQHVWAGITDPAADLTTLPIGTGPYRMIEHVADQHYRFEANQNYFRGQPTAASLDLVAIADARETAAALEAGDIDLMARSVPWDLSEQLTASGEIEVLGANRYQAVYLMFNQENPDLQNRLVRKALSLNLDSEKFLDQIVGSMGRFGTESWTHPNSPWTRNPEGERIPDRQTAEQLLDANDFPLDGDKRVTPSGQPMSFTLGYNPAMQDHTAVANLVASELAEIGVEITVQPLSLTDLAAARGDLAGPVPDVDILLDEAETNAQMNPNHLYFLFHSQAGGIGPTFGRYTNPELDALTEQTLATSESDRRPLIHQTQDILAEDLPVIALYYPAAMTAYRPSIYNGWWSDSGHGTLTKRSLLPEFADVEFSDTAAPSQERAPTEIPEALLAGDPEIASDGPLGGVDPLMVAAIATLLGAVGLGAMAMKKATADKGQIPS